MNVYRPTLAWRRDDGSTTEETLDESCDPERADDFVLWLCTKVLVPMAA